MKLWATESSQVTSQGSPFFPFVSVIVPVYNDAIRLKKCLDALEKQSYPPKSYEVIVVDNASDKQEDIEKVVSQFSHARYTYEERSGSYVARNRGVSIARGEVISFTDADCIPTSSWLENGVKALLSYPDCGLVAGKIELFFRHPPHLTPVEIYEKIMAFPQKDLVEKNHFGVTANIFTRKTIFEIVGRFDPSLKSMGDADWGRRVHAQGYQILYAENVCIFHPARYSFRELNQRTRRHAGGYYDLMRNNCQSRQKFYGEFLSSLIRDLIPPVNFTRYAFSKQELKGIREKIIASSVFAWIRYLTAWEKVRLLLGGTALRS